MNSIEIDELCIPVVIQYEKRKSVRFKFVNEICHINAPFLTEKQFLDIVKSKRNWLKKSYIYALAKVENASRVFILGKEVAIEYKETKKLDYQWNENKLFIEKPQKMQEDKALFSIKERIAYDVILPILKAEAQRMNCDYNKVSLRHMKASWGRCNSKKDISLSYRLIERDLVFIQYVCIHELAHTLVMNHSPKFWAVVEKHMKNYKQIRKMGY